MRIFPEEYRNIELSRSEKLFTQYANRTDSYGFLLLSVNPAMVENENLHVVITEKGVLLTKFFDSFNNVNFLPVFLSTYMETVYEETKKIVCKRLISNKLISGNNSLRFYINFVCVFPNINREDIEVYDESCAKFIKENCLFNEDFSRLKSEYLAVVDEYLKHSMMTVENAFEISDNNISSIMHSIAPEYTTIRFGNIEETVTDAGASNESLIVDKNDIAVKAYLLDDEQINIVNKITKGDQLILACAGSGKSVLLIAKCFKAARMNPNKKFLITCYNKNLCSLYQWYIDRAGLKERNVECITYYKLCNKLLSKNRCSVPEKIEDWTAAVANRLNDKIKDRYYGIFIDEVQMFEQDWYKLCYNLLENKNSEEHLFVICGDKTQKVKNQQRHGRAPWNVGDGYPTYRGGNKNIRIEKNYRNSIEVNDFINRFVEHAKTLIASFESFAEMDPDLFLRGKAFTKGIGAFMEDIPEFSNDGEADKVCDLINIIHDKYAIPYDEIGVVVFNKKYGGRHLPGWKDPFYDLEDALRRKLNDKRIGYSFLYNTEAGNIGRYGESEGVSIISTESVLGLDFRAVILCGLKPLGVYDRTKYLNTKEKRKNASEEDYVKVKENISQLYVACTRAKEVLYIVQPEHEYQSIYIDMLKKSFKE